MGASRKGILPTIGDNGSLDCGSGAGREGDSLDAADAEAGRDRSRKRAKSECLLRVLETMVE